MGYVTLEFFQSMLMQERCMAAACVPQGEGVNTIVSGWVVDKGDAGYEWEEDNFAPQTAQDYLDGLVIHG